MAAFRLTSSAFEHDAPLPIRFTAAAEDLSPPLAWTGLPEGTKELALVADDPDGETGVFTHWIVYGILPDEADGLPEGVPRDALVNEPVALVQGLNEFDEVGYTGPMPTEDEAPPHRLFFRLFALDVELLDLPPGVSRAELRKAAKEHILDEAVLVGIV